MSSRGKSNGSRNGFDPNKPDYLFHLQEPEKVSKGALPGREDPGKEEWSSRRAQQHFGHNVRVLLIVGGSMILFFVIAMAVAIHSWQVKEDRMIQQIPAADKLAEERAIMKVSSEKSIKPEIKAVEAQNAKTLREAMLAASRGDALCDQGKYEEGIEAYRQALTAWPGMTKAQSKLGQTYLRLKDYAKAQESLETAVDEDPTTVPVINDLGVAQFKLKRFDRALRLFQDAAQIDTNYAAAYFNMALCHLMRGDRAKAQASLAQYMAMKPGDPKAMKEIAFLDASDGKYPAALETLEAAMQKAPDWAPLYFDAAATAALMGHAKDAISYLKKAEPLSSPVALYLVYQQPAFNEIRDSEAGRAFLNEVTERARKSAAESGTGTVPENGAEPIVSF